MVDTKHNDDLERVIYICQVFDYAFGHAGLYTINDPIAMGYNTFACIHLVFTMFLVDKKEDKPIGGFIYPILSKMGKESLLDNVQAVLCENLGDITFEDYLRKYRNKLATHGDLSIDSLPTIHKELVISDRTNDRILELIDKLRYAVDNLLNELRK